jgi:hypothetical protein
VIRRDSVWLKGQKSVTDEPMTHPDDEAPFSPPHGIHLRLRHLLGFTAVVAALLAARAPYEGFSTNSYTRTYIGVNGTRAPLAALVTLDLLRIIPSAVAVTVFCAMLCHSHAFARIHHPGHWLVLDVAVNTILHFVPHAIAMLSNVIFGDPFDENGDFTTVGIYVFRIWAAIVAMSLIVRVVLNAYIGIKKCSQIRWSLVFYVHLAAAVAEAIGAFMWYGEKVLAVSNLMVFLFVAHAVIADRRDGERRDALHWCGVIVQFSLLLITLAIIGLYGWAR